MAKINPRRLQGRWREGYALDLHTLSSTYVGDNEFGHPEFSTSRSELGDLLFRLKNRADQSGVQEMVEAAADFIVGQKWNVDVLISVPPSRDRSLQPVIVLADGIGRRLGIPHDSEGIKKLRATPELKNVYDFDERVKTLKDAFNVDANRFQGRRILLFDDLYRSGATMNVIADLLYDRANASEIYALTITRTRVRS